MIKKVQKKTKQDKADFAKKLSELLSEYPVILTAGCDNISTAQIQQIRLDIRGKGVMLFGKNTIIRKVIRNHYDDLPNLWNLLPYIRGNCCMVFTTSDHLLFVRKVVASSQIPAAAKPGMVANDDVFLPKGPTGLEPTKTAFLQALNIATKINKGQVEILNDVHLIVNGEKVGVSQAALCTMLNIKPFKYNFEMGYVYDDGAIYEADSLNVTVEEILAKFHAGVATVAALALAVGIPTVASFPHSILNGFKNILAVAIESNYSFPLMESIKDRVANPGAYSAPTTTTTTTTTSAPVVEKTPTPEESSGEGMGFSFFDSE
jgi:large subunit ribosomal protein LP0